MRPSEIFTVLDLAQEARLQNRIFNPCFVGAPGVAKSALVQAWAKANGYKLIDIRLALREAPDLLGFPKVEIINGMQRQVNITPDFWPTAGEKCVVFIDEVNRGNQSVMNAIMQLLTDRVIGSHHIGNESLLVAAINPEDEQNDVNTMDSALKDRFEFFHVEYDRKEHIAFMKASGHEKTIIQWVESGTWKYERPENIGSVAGAKYLSPRSIEKLDTAIKSMVNLAERTGKAIDQKFELTCYNNILGLIQGRSFYNFKNNETPVTYSQLKDKRSRSSALAKLKDFCKPDAYKAGHVSMTVSDICEQGFDIEDELLVDIIMVMPADQGHSMLYQLQVKRMELDRAKGQKEEAASDGKDDKLTRRIFANFPKVKTHFKDVLNG